MGFLDWVDRTRNGISELKPRATWISDVYADQGTWAWAWVQQTQSGRFDAGMTMRDRHFGVWKERFGQGFSNEAHAIRLAQSEFKLWRKNDPEMKIASAHVHDVVNYWHVMAETQLGRELANQIAGGQMHDPIESRTVFTPQRQIGEHANQPDRPSPDKTDEHHRIDHAKGPARAAEKYGASQTAAQDPPKVRKSR